MIPNGKMFPADKYVMRKYINIVSRLLLEADLDKSHAARMQRARDMGFDVDDPHYHGSPAGDFDEFDPERTADEDLAYGKGVYASRDPEVASGYSKPGSSWGNEIDDARPTVYKVFLRVKNPFDLDKIYPFAEIKRIFEHCFEKDQLENNEFWNDILKEAGYNVSDDDEYGDQEPDERTEIEDRLSELEDATEHEDVDPDDYEDGEDDPEYREDVEAAVASERKSLKRQLEFIERRENEEHEFHQKALANGRIASAYGRDIYKQLWQNTDDYHDWKAESKLFGGDTGTFEFKTQANEWLEELGYDGIRHVDQYNPGGKKKPHVVTIAFNPNQVRSVHANFDPEKKYSPKMHEGKG